METAERLAYAGILSNMVTYLTDVLNESTATAAKNVNAWSGVASMLPFVGAFVAIHILVDIGPLLRLLSSICWLVFPFLSKCFYIHIPRDLSGLPSA